MVLWCFGGGLGGVSVKEEVLGECYEYEDLWFFDVIIF